MMEQSSQQVWKFDVGERVELDTVETLLAEAMQSVMREAHPEGPSGELQRVDLREKQTTVFMTGNGITATTFSNSLKKRFPSARVTKITSAEIMRFQ
jgi:hypothetical protein